VVPLPRSWLLASALLSGSAAGQLAGVAVAMLHLRVRPDFAIALVVGVPSVIGLLVILFSGRRWVTLVGAFILALAPGWFAMLIAVQVASSG
jgi:hypothetical protein